MDAEQRRDVKAIDELIDVLANNPLGRVVSTTGVRESLMIPRRARREEAEAAFTRAVQAWMESKGLVAVHS